jgi:hypothetical protein
MLYGCLFSTSEDRRFPCRLNAAVTSPGIYGHQRQHVHRRERPEVFRGRVRVWISYSNPKGAMNNANVNLHDNTIEGIDNTTNPSYRATALGHLKSKTHSA